MPRRTLLVIDDEPAIATLIKRIAESCAYDVEATSDPKVFQARVGSAPPDVICLDLAMPLVDGVEMLGTLADQSCPSALLIISGFERGIVSSALRLADARGLNVAGMIPKPVRVAELKALLLQLAGDGSAGVIASPKPE